MKIKTNCGKLRDIFDKLIDSHAKYCSLTVYLAVDEIVPFRGRVIFRHYLPKKHDRFGIMLYRFCDCKGYVYNMTLYLGPFLCCCVVSIFKLNGAYSALHILRENLMESGTFWSLFILLTVSPP